jgi:hypothetical protein
MLPPFPQPEIIDPNAPETSPFVSPAFKWKTDWHDRYIGTAKKSKISGLILDKAKLWNRQLSGYFEQCRRNYLLYHNRDPFSGNTASFDITGAHGEYVELRINHFRNLLQHMMNLIFAKPDAYKSVASNAEPSSTTAADAFDAYLEQVFKRERAQKSLYQAGELALLFGPGFNTVSWDLSRGEPWMTTERNEIINTGGPSIRALSALDACWDLAIRDWRDLPWFIERDAVNRFEFLAAHPDHEEAILNAPSIDEQDPDYAPTLIAGEESDCIWRWTLHVRPVNSLVLPEGRRTVIIDGSEEPIEDDDHPYGEIPIVRTAPMEQLGSLLGYTSAHDIAPCQMFYNVIMRAIATAVAANGVGNITAPRGSDLDLETLIGGCNIVYYNPDPTGGGAKPEALNLLELTAEIQQLPGLVERIMETISGVNAAVRGSPDESLKSGRAIATVIGQTVQFMSGFHQSKTQSGEDTANLLLRLAQKYLTTEQMVQMIGAEKFARFGKLTSEGLRRLARVNAEAVDPTLYTMAGKLQLADKLLETQAIKTPHEYFEVVRTGNIEVLTNANTSMTRGVRDENSALLRGEMVPVLFTDDDNVHLPEHIALLDGPEARANMKTGRYNALIAHIMEHTKQQQEKLAAATPVMLPQGGAQPAGPQQAPVQQPAMQPQPGAAAPAQPEAAPI